jgi:hypothetical protein
MLDGGRSHGCDELLQHVRRLKHHVLVAVKRSDHASKLPDCCVSHNRCCAAIRRCRLELFISEGPLLYCDKVQDSEQFPRNLDIRLIASSVEEGQDIMSSPELIEVPPLIQRI